MIPEEMIAKAEHIAARYEEEGHCDPDRALESVLDTLDNVISTLATGGRIEPADSQEFTRAAAWLLGVRRVSRRKQ